MFDFITKKFTDTTPYSPVDKNIFKAYNKNRPGRAKDLICYVPFNSLTFSWLGKVYACTYNRNILVGEYPADSIRDIWFSERLKTMQGYLKHNDLSYGCQHCKYFVEKEKFTGLKPQSFDKYSDYEKHRYPRVMEFETSIQCNLGCIMCNGIDYSEQKDNYQNAILTERDTLNMKTYNNRNELYDMIRESDIANTTLSKEEIIKRIDSLFTKLNNTVIEQKILSDIATSPMEIMFKDISTRSEDELYEKIKKQYRA